MLISVLAYVQVLARLISFHTNTFNYHTHDNVQIVSNLLQVFKGSLPHPTYIHLHNMFQSVNVAYTRRFIFDIVVTISFIAS